MTELDERNPSARERWGGREGGSALGPSGFHEEEGEGSRIIT